MKWRLTGYILLMLKSFSMLGQESPAPSILLGAVIENGDTIPVVFLKEVECKARLPKKWAKKQAEFNRLRYNVYKVYPYAKIAAEVLKDVDKNLEKMPTKQARKDYLKSVEKELKKRFKGELEDLTVSQGHVLVKLIDRETGKSCFHIIKEMKGGFSATLWQSVAVLFSHNLKKKYDPLGDDKDMESIVQEMLASNYYRYYYYQQQQKQLQAKKN